MMVDGHPKLSRVAPSSQRMRDGTLHPDRAEKLLTNPPKYLHKMHQHPEKLKDGSPRGHATPSCFDLGFPPQWQTTSRQSYEMPASNPMGGQPPAGASSSFAGGGRDRQSANDGPSNRYASVALSRLSPDVYLSVFNRDAKEPPGSPRHLPIEARTTARGSATVPTAPDWAETNLLLPSARLARRINPPTRSPRIQAADDQFRMELLEAQVRSEARQMAAKLALAVDKQFRPSSLNATPLPSPRFAMSPRMHRM